MANATKICMACYEELPITDFHKNCATHDNLHTACKACRCSYAAFATDREYKRVKARQRYVMTRCQEKAKRVAIHVLQRIEASYSQIDNCPKRPATAILADYVPAETVTAISLMLQSHLGPDVYWTGFGERWRIVCRKRPRITIWARQNNLACFVRELMQPDNLLFEDLTA